MKKTHPHLLALLLLAFCLQSFSQTSEPSYGGLTLSEAANGHEYVDLGLPSGTLWATMNVGAIKPAGYGNYFAWGETTGYSEGKEEFSWKNYKYSKGSASKITKYMVDRKKAREIGLITDSSLLQMKAEESTDELELEDDAARANWGGAWRMPNVKEFVELVSNCDRELVPQNGRMGWMFTSKLNGNSIFFPLCGFRDKTLFNVGAYAYYWTRNLYARYSGGAYVLYLEQGVVNPSDNYYRAYGRSVRPVLEVSK